VGSKAFSTGRSAAGILFSKKFVAIAACVLFIGALTTYYYIVESGFNPVPQQATLAGANICPSENGTCPGFGLGNASLRLFNLTDIVSQQISFVVVPKEAGSMARLYVYIDNISLGEVKGPFASGTPKLVALGVPTTITVTPGVSYEVVVEGVFSGSLGTASTEYWQSFSVVASAG
jgi:hypothetical protein